MKGGAGDGSGDGQGGEGGYPPESLWHPPQYNRYKCGEAATHIPQTVQQGGVTHRIRCLMALSWGAGGGGETGLRDLTDQTL